MQVIPIFSASNICDSNIGFISSWKSLAVGQFNSCDDSTFLRIESELTGHITWIKYRKHHWANMCVITFQSRPNALLGAESKVAISFVTNWIFPNHWPIERYVSTEVKTHDCLWITYINRNSILFLTTTKGWLGRNFTFPAEFWQIIQFHTFDLRLRRYWHEHHTHNLAFTDQWYLATF